MTGDVPDFTLWEAFACDDPQVAGTPTCADNPDCVSDNCVEFLGDAGVCSYSDIDIWCDGEGGVMGTGDGSCWICLEPYEHARACCADPGVFDCRTWPFTDTPGIVGQVCATHTDCEPGLACSEPRWILEFHPTGPPCVDDDDCAMGVCNDLYHQCGEEVPHFAGYGICACPGTDSMEIVPGPACFE